MGNAVRQEKEITVFKIGEEENKTVFAYNTIVYVGKKTPRVLAKSQMNTLSKVSTQKS